jgi:hypothetical protein
VKKTILALALTLPMAGCLTVDDQERIQFSSFKVSPDRTFTFETDANMYESESLETMPIPRQSWMQEWLTQNNMCPNGFRIVDRQRVVKGGSIMGKLYRVSYTGRCA